MEDDLSSYHARDDSEIEKERIKILEHIADWARKYPELYEIGLARNTIATNLAHWLHQLDIVEGHIRAANAQS